MSTVERFPAWVREVQTLLPVCSHFVVFGNVRDIYFCPPDGVESTETELVELPQLLDRALAAIGVRVVLRYEPASGSAEPFLHGVTPEEADTIAGGSPQRAGAGNLEQLADLIGDVSSASEPVGLVIESASRLALSVQHLSEQEFAFFRRVDRISRTARRLPASGGRSLHSPVIWVVDDASDLPAWFTAGNDALRSISVPLPDSGERARLAGNVLPTLAPGGLPENEGEQRAALARPIRVLTEQTAGFGLAGVRNVWRVARDQGLGPDNVDDAARAYRVGVVENPWRAEFISNRLRYQIDPTQPWPGPSEAPQLLSERVLGQPDAVRKTLDILARSVAGLTAAQAGPSAMRPRGVLFFAGPTGVGKTELAKAVTKMLFDDERFYIRFDMSEFSEEHAANRLIGSPPGYVGSLEGGELTNAIRERPFSVVLFDEIEKGHPRILDKFLQVLDDGRLTDGRGDTAFFTESVIIFTSNLGIYREVQELVGGVTVTRRELAVSPMSHPSQEERAEAIRQAIHDHFTLRLGRPELLNRIGEDNIVAFDFIDPETAFSILEGMLRNVMARVEREHGHHLTLTDESVERLRQACLSDDVLAMGGRGIGSKVETALINPLSRLLVMSPLRDGATPTVGLEETGGVWGAKWT